MDCKKWLAKEIAYELKVSPGYVSAMRRAGLPVITTPAEAIEWLKNHENFRKNGLRERTGKNGKERAT